MASIDFIIPVFNEGPALERFHAALTAALTELAQHSFRFLYINDGSTDDTTAVLDRMASPIPASCLSNSAAISATRRPSALASKFSMPTHSS